MTPFEELNQIFPDIGRMAALVKHLGGQETVDQILSDEYEVVLQKKIKPLFDRHGRLIPHKGESVLDPVKTSLPEHENIHLDNYFYEDYRPDWKRFVDYYSQAKISVEMGSAEFQTRVQDIYCNIHDNVQLKRMLYGPSYPILLPRMIVNDYGFFMGRYFLPCMFKAYSDYFPEAEKVIDWGDENTQMKVLKKSRHSSLLQKMVTENVVGILFPLALQSYTREQAFKHLKDLPENVLLMGGIDLAAAMIGHCEYMGKDGYCPTYDIFAIKGSEQEDDETVFQLSADGEEIAFIEIFSSESTNIANTSGLLIL